MRKSSLSEIVGSLAIAGFIASPALAQQQQLDVLISGKLTPGFNMGVNSSEGKTNWLKAQPTELKLSYPPDQQWGSVFVTVGPPRNFPRPFRDLSAFDTLTVEMRGGVGQETVSIGVKSNSQADDGGEIQMPIKLTSEWKSFSFLLSKFDGADPEKLYVVTEFVFTGPEPATAFVRRISYSKSQK